MTARYFVDSNVVVYARDISDLDKQKRAALWIEFLAENEAGHLSYQVLIEAYSVLIRSSRHRLPKALARAYIANFQHWRPIAIDQRIIGSAWDVQDRYNFNWWDCLIVAAAREAGCSHLLTEDLQHGQSLDGLLVVNPFEISPPSPLALS